MLLPTLLALGCGPAEVQVAPGGGEPGEVSSALSTLRLVEAHQVIGTVTGEGRWAPYRAPLADLGYGALLTGMVRGVVEAHPSSANAKVVVHYSTRASNDWGPQTWHDVEARRVDATHWEFSTAPFTLGNSFHYLPRFVTTFALKLEDGARTTWDNNGGQDFVISGDDGGGWVPVYAGPFAVLTERPLVVESAWWEGSHLRGDVVVRNVGAAKAVRVVASTDGWKTRVEGEAQYVKTFSQSELERWRFDLFAPATSLEAVEFAVVVESGGSAAWDNNLGRNYTLRLDGAGSPWALGPVQAPGRVVFEGPSKSYAVSVATPTPADGALTLVYAPERLTTCRGTKYGLPAWGLVAYVRAPGQGDFVSQGFATMKSPGALVTPVFFTTGRALETYFFNSDAVGCRAWDSNFGQNFVVRW